MQTLTVSAQEGRTGYGAIDLSLRFSVCLAAVGLALAGCATSGADPRQARPNTGYVDIHGDSAAQVSWQVDRFEDQRQDFRRIFVDWEPSPNGIVRLALAPGSQRLRITCINRVTTGPVEIPVEVQNDKITPVCIRFKPKGTSLVESTETSVGGTLYGTYGRRTKVTGEEDARYEMSAAAEPSVAYQPEGEMPYARQIQKP